MILISSMGGCGSTEFIHWFSRHIDCNCSMNSEGLPFPGPGANFKGLKHRICPPQPDDKYLPIGKTIEKSLFLFDSPCQIIPSLFRRKIAVGHATAITGICPEYNNDLDGFLLKGIDSFGFSEQFGNWVDAAANTGYPRMLVRASAFWSHLPQIFAYLKISADLRNSFPRQRSRGSSFAALSSERQLRIMEIYAELDRTITSFPDVRLI